MFTLFVQQLRFSYRVRWYFVVLNVAVDPVFQVTVDLPVRVVGPRVFQDLADTGNDRLRDTLKSSI